ncbi:hypothetical protein GQX73_g10947 [Xylaria multiplex]|uniref:Uncharacterized protein n=1 Tax=Xylaria multiplex TaxID=323545 RepID=A0A7C8IFX6_9PEZI|nr:hypothetical protein GQX73_g10947 [Xylaria multiplex]
MGTPVSGAPLTLPPPPPLPQEADSLRQDEVVEISSDNKSDGDNLEDSQSRRQAEPGSVAGAGKGINTTPGTSSNNTKKPSVTSGSNPDDKSTSTQQQLEPLSALPKALRAKLDQPGLAGSAAHKLGQAPASKGSVYDTTVPKTARQGAPIFTYGGETPEASPTCQGERIRSPTIGDNHNENGSNIVPSQGHKRCKTRVHQPRDLSETRLSNEGDKVIPDSDRSSNRNAHGDKHFAPTHNGRAEEQDKDADKEDSVQPPAPKRQKSNRHPPEDEEGDDIYQPPDSIFTRTTLPRSQRVRMLASGRQRSGQHSVLSSPSSQKSIDPKPVFEEWPLGNAVLKRVTVNGITTFQVQFTWDSCAMHKHKDRATKDPQDTFPVKRSPSLRRGGAAGPRLTPEDTLIELTGNDAQSAALTEEKAK